MLTPVFAKSSEIIKCICNEDSVILLSEAGKTRLTIYAEDIIRVLFTNDEEFSMHQGEEFLPIEAKVPFEVNEEENEICISTEKLKAHVNRKTGSVAFFRKTGEHLFSEDANNSHILEKFDIYKTVGNIEVEEIKTADGVKKRIKSADREYDKSLYHTKLNMCFDKDEMLFGLGQAEEGVWNLRNTTQYLNQANKKIAIPFLVSNKGYGILFSTQSPAIFSDSENGSYFYTSADYYLDYFFIAPERKDRIVAGMRKISGKALIPPKWAFGYVQSQERYESEEEILSVADKFIKHDIPVSCLVLDWLSWEDGMWGQKSFDKKRFPSPEKMIEKLHEKDIHFMISIWPSMDEKCANYKEMLENRALLNGINICNAFDKKARELYWKQAKEGLADRGIESWWCDSSEPMTPEWNHLEEQPPAICFSEYVKTVEDVMPIEKANAYGYYHALGMYEGQKKDFPDRRMLILTRNGYIGSQRLGVTLWSGDISATWEVLAKQTVAAIQFSLTGIPYWTFDIGGFFVKNGINWYWNGDYNDTTDNPGYRELYTRWLQLGCFLPMFRAHGTDCRREPWNFSDETNMFYDSIKKFIELRYRLLPYIYSVAGRVWKDDEMFISPLFTQFEDEVVCGISSQFMFGPSLMVCPVLKPMYFDKFGNGICEEKIIPVYLPKDCDWYDWWTGKKFCGGQIVEADADISKMPLFVREGSIIPVSEDITLKEKYTTVDKLYFPDKNGTCSAFELYADDGASYNYLTGKYNLTTLT